MYLANLMKFLGQVKTGIEDLYFWVNNLELTSAVKSSYAPNRLEMWFGLGSNLQSIKDGRAAIFQAEEPSQRIKDLGNRVYPGWNSILVCGGLTDIDWHRDHGHFERKAVMINLGTARYSECTKADGFTPIDWEDYALVDGDVVEIDTKLLHMAKQISPIRFNVTFRKVKSEYLPQSNSQAKQLTPF